MIAKAASSLVGVLSRRRGPAVTALFTQLGALAGMPVGVTVFWLFRQLADLSQLSLVLRRFYRWAEQRFHSLRESKEHHV